MKGQLSKPWSQQLLSYLYVHITVFTMYMYICINRIQIFIVYNIIYYTHIVCVYIYVFFSFMVSPFEFIIESETLLYAKESHIAVLFVFRNYNMVTQQVLKYANWLIKYILRTAILLHMKLSLQVLLSNNFVFN